MLNNCRFGMAVLGLASVLFQANCGRADEWPTPQPRLFASEYGQYACKVLPRKNAALGEQGRATLFTLTSEGAERVIWSRELVNLPHRVLVAEGGEHVVTIDTYGRLGFEHALVVYGKEGKLLADYPLEDLLTAGEVEQHVVQSKSSRWWAREAAFSFTHTVPGPALASKIRASPHLQIKLSWGKTILLDLTTGKIASDPTPSRR